MRKLKSEMIEEPREARRGPSARLVLVLIVVVVSLPLLIESALACTAQWRRMAWGEIVHVDTPILDTVGLRYRAATRAIRLRAARAFSLLPWQPSLVIGLGLGLAVLACIPLRKAS